MFRREFQYRRESLEENWVFYQAKVQLKSVKMQDVSVFELHLDDVQLSDYE